MSDSKKPELVYRKKVVPMCGHCGNGDVMYEIYELNGSKYKTRTKQSGCLSYSSCSSGEEEIDLEDFPLDKKSENKEVQNMYDYLSQVSRTFGYGLGTKTDQNK